ncbi:protease FtsH subunit HflK [Faunimonas pinastri]|uniref:Protein HflK n=1 Tax=Faunimonas pinastri TaxID=1855383 RepID=A0A1H9FMK4_9HYPH|nr:FtsH protease activity modulator HflK [Faunimonas pinastri]SEQ39079.1 protease FtsH subunit HflK [Faunimonas pinastri]
MPWNNNTGDGGGNGWKGGGPWGSGPQQPPRGPNSPPDLNDLLRQSQDRLRTLMPSGGRGNLAIGALVVLVLLGVWLMECIYTVQPDELGQELVFGKPKQEVAEPGPHFMLWPIETVEKVSIRQRRTSIGSNTDRGGQTSGLMLSADQNIVNVTFTVIWRVSDPKKYLFNVAGADDFVTRIADSAMREYVGRARAEDVRTEKRAEVEGQVLALLQGTLDTYGAGITVIGVQLEKADPPEQVADAFEEVQRAQQDLDRYQREAEQYANKKLGDANAQAAQIRGQAAGYKDQMIAEGQGEAQRFTFVLGSYQASPDISRRRLYLETLEDVLKNSNKIIIDKGVGNILPYLPLNASGQARASIAPPPAASGSAESDVASVQQQALPTLSASDMGGQ